MLCCWLVVELSSDLVVAARDGSPEALNAVFRACGGRLLALIRLRLGPALRAQLESRDILQATFLKAFTRIDQVRAQAPDQLMAWLATIAEHEIRDQLDYFTRQRRDVQREIPLESRLPEPMAAELRSMTSRLELDQRLARVEAALDTLTGDHREVIALRYFAELSFADIGRRLGRSPDASRMLFARAMAALTMAVRGVP